MVKERSDEYVKDYAAQFIIGLSDTITLPPRFDTKDLNSRKETLEVTGALIREAAAEGYGEYRTHNALMDDVMATFNWGDGALHKFHETLKDALDPNSIMAPGKSGIWSKRFRGRNLLTDTTSDGPVARVAGLATEGEGHRSGSCSTIPDQLRLIAVEYQTSVPKLITEIDRVGRLLPPQGPRPSPRPNVERCRSRICAAGSPGQG